MVGRKKGSTALTPLELQIMQVLWSEGPSSVAHVQKRLAPDTDLAYNTVQTMLNILHRKGRVKRKLDGRAHVYRTVATRETVMGQALRDFVERMFGGSSEDLVMSLIKSRQVDPQRIAELSLMLKTKQAGDKDD